MEIVHNIASRPWIDQKKIKIKDFIKEWEEMNIKQFLHLNEENLENNIRKNWI